MSVSSLNDDNIYDIFIEVFPDHHGAGGGVADEHGEQGGDEHEGCQEAPPPRPRQHQHSQSKSPVDPDILNLSEF